MSSVVSILNVTYFNLDMSWPFFVSLITFKELVSTCIFDEIYDKIVSVVILVSNFDKWNAFFSRRRLLDDDVVVDDCGCDSPDDICCEC